MPVTEHTSPSIVDGQSSLGDGLTVSACRFVVDALHPRLGTVFLFYCASEIFDPFYVVLVDAQSRRKRVPVGRKALSLVRRITTLHIVPRVSSTLLKSQFSSAPSSRSSSDVLSDMVSGPSAVDDVDDGDALVLWQDVLLSIAKESTGQCSSTFTAACQRVLHSPDDVRRWYEWSCVFAGGDLPIHLALRRLELRTSSDAGKHDLLLSPHSEFADGESFVATCDPLAIDCQSRQQEPQQRFSNAFDVDVTPAPADAARETLCFLSPLTPARSSGGDVNDDVSHTSDVPGASLSLTVAREAPSKSETSDVSQAPLAVQRFQTRAALHKTAHRSGSLTSPLWREPVSACAAPVSKPHGTSGSSPWNTSYL